MKPENYKERITKMNELQTAIMLNVLIEKIETKAENCLEKWSSLENKDSHTGWMYAGTFFALKEISKLIDELLPRK